MRKMENLNVEKFRTACARCSHTVCKSSGAWKAKIQVFSSSHSMCEISLTAGQKMAKSSKVSVSFAHAKQSSSDAEQTCLS